jgi:hypothetical protein
VLFLIAANGEETGFGEPSTCESGFTATELQSETVTGSDHADVTVQRWRCDCDSGEDCSRSQDDGTLEKVGCYYEFRAAVRGTDEEARVNDPDSDVTRKTQLKIRDLFDTHQDDRTTSSGECNIMGQRRARAAALKVRRSQQQKKSLLKESDTGIETSRKKIKTTTRTKSKKSVLKESDEVTALTETGQCKNWCKNTDESGFDSNPWAAKCSYDSGKCSTCNQCDNVQTVTDDNTCKLWCQIDDQNRPWTTKCGWNACSGCPQCSCPNQACLDWTTVVSADGTEEVPVVPLNGIASSAFWNPPWKFQERGCKSFGPEYVRTNGARVHGFFIQRIKDQFPCDVDVEGLNVNSDASDESDADNFETDPWELASAGIDSTYVMKNGPPFVSRWVIGGKYNVAFQILECWTDSQGSGQYQGKTFLTTRATGKFSEEGETLCGLDELGVDTAVRKALNKMRYDHNVACAGMMGWWKCN